MVSLGIEKIRLTGGEPLLRAGLVEMVRELARMRAAYERMAAESARARRPRHWTSRLPPTGICWRR